MTGVLILDADTDCNYECPNYVHKVKFYNLISAVREYHSQVS